jgi:hypothetical protein
MILIVFAVFLFGVLVLGHLLISTKPVNFFFISLLITGAIIGVVVSLFFFKLLPHISPEKWVLLDMPPKGKVTKVALAQNNYGTLHKEYVETDLGEIYQLQYDYDNPSSSKWTKVAWASSLQSFNTAQTSVEHCESYTPSDLDRFVDSKVVCNGRDFSIYSQAIAVDNTGKVYVLRNIYTMGISIDVILFVSTPYFGAFLGVFVTFSLYLLLNSPRSTFYLD